ncbi:hypothetical protein AVEN_159064-1 [Araneus ventricosus]|uniref:Uncharacterized protein n=1 Tax=Araneus ventricosus TaxID=182803 RepID=A0A4Y2B9M4_ARAVE|nr:hypothetical protein AVEN_159064-1 [Araneus ventricosus]
MHAESIEERLPRQQSEYLPHHAPSPPEGGTSRLKNRGSLTPVMGRGGLVVRSRLWGRRVPGSRPDSTEDPPCMGPVAR